VIYITSVCKSTRLKPHKKAGLIRETKESSVIAVICGFAFWLISGYIVSGFIAGIVIGLLFIFMFGFDKELDYKKTLCRIWRGVSTNIFF
jgi:hypothetical protein